MVAGARDKSRDTREGGNTASVPPLKSNRNVGKDTWFSGLSVRPFPGACFLLSWLRGPGLWPSVPVLFVVWSRRVVLALLHRLVSSARSVSKKRRRQKAPTRRPGFFLNDRPRAERALCGGRE